jgi:hypothetical protein
MRRFVLFVFIIGFFTVGHAQPTSSLFVNPYYPEFNQPDDDLSRTLMDANLENEVRQYMERRDRIQQLYLEFMPQDPGLLPKNSFITKRFLDRGSRRLLKSSWIRKSSVGRAADHVKNNMQTDVDYVDSMSRSHHFDFKIAAFQGEAFIQYSGFTKAQLRYSLSNGGSLAMIFQHDLTALSSIGIESTLTGDNRTQSVLLNILW